MKTALRELGELPPVPEKVGRCRVLLPPGHGAAADRFRPGVTRVRFNDPTHEHADGLTAVYRYFRFAEDEETLLFFAQCRIPRTVSALDFAWETLRERTEADVVMETRTGLGLQEVALTIRKMVGLAWSAALPTLLLAQDSDDCVTSQDPEPNPDDACEVDGVDVTVDDDGGGSGDGGDTGGDGSGSPVAPSPEDRPSPAPFPAPTSRASTGASSGVVSPVPASAGASPGPAPPSWAGPSPPRSTPPPER